MRYTPQSATSASSIKFTGALIPASGGNTVQDIGGYRIHTFTTVGTSTLTAPSNLLVDVLLVAGGGGGGQSTGGGGGAGGLIFTTLQMSPGIYTVTVGDGGNGSSAGGDNAGRGFTGSPSIISGTGIVTQTAVGGGGGGHSGTTPGSGGSGGGGVNSAAGAGTAGQGNAGGLDSGAVSFAGGGGGGAGQVGQIASGSVGGNGGNGLAYTTSGTSTYYAGGGAGAKGLGGLGGGGSAVAGGGTGGIGTPNTGGGGAGGTYNGTFFGGGKGGSGIVIVRYPFPFPSNSTMRVTTGGSIQMYRRPSLTPVLVNPGSLELRDAQVVTISQTALQPTNGITWNFYPTGYGLSITSSTDYALTLVASAVVSGTVFTVVATNRVGSVAIIQFTASAAPIFSLLSNTAAASTVGVYSLRSLISVYARVVNIRNGTTSATQDFYADTVGNLTTQTGGSGQQLVSWLSGATGFVETLYDQSINVYNLSQPTTANQPPINLTTTPYSIIFDGSNRWLYNASVPLNMGAASFTFRYVVSNNTGGCILFKASGITFTWNGGEKSFWLGNGSTTEGARGNFPAFVGNGMNFVVSSAAITEGGVILKNSVVHKATSTTAVPIYINGLTASLGTNNISMFSDAGNYLIIGRGGNNANYIGNIFEIELFSTPLSDADRFVLETSYLFTNMGATGQSGPTSVTYGGSIPGVTLASGIQVWTIATTRTYTFVVAGAAGGTATSAGPNVGGAGRIISGNVSLIAGDIIYIVVGQKGNDNQYQAGGGGGTFVFKNTYSNYLFAAGGGGGGAQAAPAGNGRSETSGGTGANTDIGTGGIGGTNGGGGAGGLRPGHSTGGSGTNTTVVGGSAVTGLTQTPGGGGAGIGAIIPLTATFLGGGAGTGGSINGSVGGFGGGGGSGAGNGGGGGAGGGGGYSGGGGGSSTTGGGGFGGGGGSNFGLEVLSYNTAVGTNTGHGFVYVSY